MPRKNDPQQTLEKVIAVSAVLFFEKGYDQTSMQDIVNALGMSKGAIFHHFKSKEEIFEAVMSKQFDETVKRVYQWLKEKKELSGREKLSGLLKWSLEDRINQDLDDILANQFQKKNSRVIMAVMQASVNRSASIVAEIIREGIMDGSIQTDFPEECAEVFMLLLNIWCDPTIFPCDKAQLLRRIEFLLQMMKQMGIDLEWRGEAKGYVTFMEKYYKS